ncbi:hypothetical protein BGZ81_007020 [Podila clonocystis]|nr:hypothetical protein BGZ81_007020 [Podila clonocystis]
MSDFTDWFTTPRNYAIFRKKGQMKKITFRIVAPYNNTKNPQFNKDEQWMLEKVREKWRTVYRKYVTARTYAEDPEHVDLPGYSLREQNEKIMPDFDRYDAVLRDEVENGPVKEGRGRWPKVSEEPEDSDQLEQSDLSDEDTTDLSSAEEIGNDSSDDDGPQSKKRKIEQLDTFRVGLMQCVESNKDRITPAMTAKFERIGVNFEKKMRLLKSKERLRR